MQCIGRVSGDFCSSNTCQHKGRVLNFSQNEGKLVVIETILRDNVEFVEVQTGVDCTVTRDDYITCCSFGAHVLVMAGKSENVFAALVELDERRLSAETVHASILTVSGDTEWSGFPYLCQVRENRILLYCADHSNMWYCDITGDRLNARKLATEMPTEEGLDALPICLSDGKLLVAGANAASPGVTLISCDGEPQFEKIGDVPGVATRWASSILIRDRLVVGFGGWNNDHLADLWIFDLQTRRSSIVWEKGEWAPGSSLSVLVLQHNILYIIREQVHSITLEALSKLIDDDKIRDAFCEVLGLPSAPGYVPPPRGSVESAGMVRLAGSLPIKSYNTVQRKGRILHFSLSEEELVVSEVIFFGQRVKLITARTGVRMAGKEIGCCLFGNRILAVAGKERDSVYSSNRRDGDSPGNEGSASDRAEVSAALVDVDEGRLSKEAVHVLSLTVDGDAGWATNPFLCQVSEARVLLYFHESRSMWHCDITNDRLKMRELKTQMPTWNGFNTLPIRLSDGKLLVAGAGSYSADITLISCDGEPQFKKVGDIPGGSRRDTSSVLIGGRFAAGFGGCDGILLDDLWIFDLQSLGGSKVREQGNWHPRDCLVFLVVQNDALYLFGNTISCISLAALAGLIEKEKLRTSFCWHMGLPFTPLPCFSGRGCANYVPERL